MNYKEIIYGSEFNKMKYTDNEQFPPAVIIETTNFCNLKCSCCAHDKMKREKGVMQLELYKKIIKEVADVDKGTNIWMVFYGEPLTLRYKIVYLIDYAKKAGLKNVFMNTNGILLDDEISEAIIDAKLDKIVFSLDAYYEDTYKRIRNNDNFEKVKNNILQFIKTRNRLNSPIEIEIQLIELPGVHKENEIYKFKEYWVNQGAKVKVKQYLTWTNEINIDKRDGIKRYPCTWLFKTFVATWNGKVVQCGCDYDGKSIAGDLNNTSIKDIWQKN